MTHIDTSIVVGKERGSIIFIDESSITLSYNIHLQIIQRLCWLYFTLLLLLVSVCVNIEQSSRNRVSPSKKRIIITFPVSLHNDGQNSGSS